MIVSNVGAEAWFTLVLKRFPLLMLIGVKSTALSVGRGCNRTPKLKTVQKILGARPILIQRHIFFPKNYVPKIASLVHVMVE